MVKLNEEFYLEGVKFKLIEKEQLPYCTYKKYIKDVRVVFGKKKGLLLSRPFIRDNVPTVRKLGYLDFVSVKVKLPIFFEYILDSIEKEILEAVGEDTFRSFYDLYSQYRKARREDDFVWKLDKRYTDGDEKKWKKKYDILKQFEQFIDYDGKGKELYFDGWYAGSLSMDFHNYHQTYDLNDTVRLVRVD